MAAMPMVFGWILTLPTVFFLIFVQAYVLPLRVRLELALLQPLRWCCVDCVIHHERDVREE